MHERLSLNAGSFGGHRSYTTSEATLEAAAHGTVVKACKTAACDGDLADVTCDVARFRVSASEMVACDASWRRTAWETLRGRERERSLASARCQLFAAAFSIASGGCKLELVSFSNVISISLVGCLLAASTMKN